MERITRFRASILLTLVLAMVVFMAGRLYYLQIIETGGEVDNTTTFTTVTRVKAARGTIFDRNGKVLVGNRASYDLVINHYVLTNSANPNQSLYDLVKLCQELGIALTDHLPVTREAPFRYTLESYNTTWQRFFQQFLENRGGLDSDITAPLLIQELRKSYLIPEEWTDEEARTVLGLRYELTLRTLDTGLSNYVFQTDVSNEHLSAIVELNVPGMRVEASTIREFQTSAAAHVLGYVGSMSPEQWEYYKTVDRVPDIDDYLMDAEVGQSGFELAFEEYLHGIDGWRYDEVTADGTIIDSWYDPAPIAGSNVEVTLDISLQEVAEESVDQVMQALYAKNTQKDDEDDEDDDGEADTEDTDGADAGGAAVVVMEVGTGEVLVCGSYPTYDLKTLFDDYDELIRNERNPLLNRALGALYPPGSTLKPGMTVAAMESGLITPKTKIQDKGEWELSDVFSLYCLHFSKYGMFHGGDEGITAAYALEVSCNYFYYTIGDLMDISDSDFYLEQLGLGQKTGVELYEEAGHRANEQTKQELYPEGYRTFSQAERLQASIGQSDHLFTPIQLCTYVSTLASQGVRYEATFLNQVVSSDYRTLIKAHSPNVLSVLDISDETYKAYVEGMMAVAHGDDGTASDTFYNYPMKICAKTGTAETGYTVGSDNGAFICFAPAENPQIAIAIYGERAGHGSDMAAIAKAILDYYFEVGFGSGVEVGENQLS